MTRGGGAPERGGSLAGTLPLLQALPLPAVLFELDGKPVAASPSMEELLGRPLDEMTGGEFVGRLRIRYPAGRPRTWSDLHRDLARERHPAVAIDVHDSDGGFHAMIATASLVGPDDGPLGILIVYSEVTKLIEKSAAPHRAPRP